MLTWLRGVLGKNPTQVQYPPLPEDVALYVVGDIHGCVDPLLKTFSSIDRDRADTRPPYQAEIYLGDYVDRGPDSRQVIELLRQRAETHRVIFLKGNHDAMMQEFATGRRSLADWLPYGATDTLRSYGATPDAIAANSDELPHLFPRDHLAFLSRCEYSFEVDDYFFVHAGVRPGQPLHTQTPEDLMWVRDEFLDHRGSFGAIVVHGHTPVPKPEFKSNRIGIDTGAYMTGQLSCLRIGGDGPRILNPGA